MPRVLLLCEYPTLNGGEQSMLATLDGVRQAGYAVVAAAPPEGPLAETLRSRGVEVEPFPVVGADGTRRSQASLREELSGILRRRRPDLLHANSLSMGRLSGPVAVACGVPGIAHLRDIVRLSRQAAADLNCHARLLAVSQAVREFHVAGGLTKGKVHVLHNGVDLRRFRPRPPTGWLRDELSLPLGAALLGTIGQIGLRKGQDLLARAAGSIAARHPLAHFVIVGRRHSEKAESRRFEADLRTVAEDLPGRFHFLGVRGDVECILNETTLLVHPARQEPLGRVLLEAAASGVAVVATDVGGTREIFPPDAAALVPPGDPGALADAVDRLLSDEALRSALAAAARRRAEEAFGAEQAATALIGHYRAL
jgi:glycosyltransferase involved in cell wall biosynthesis